MILFEPHEDYQAAIIRYEDDRAVYSFERLVDILMKLDSMTYSEAVDWICYNMQDIGFANWPIIEEEYIESDLEPLEEDSE